jgi:alkanesulfonate monooxygenase SsuD/methylene tetrahydromethanopterin reductase-like flavin-dependent oxidoreductase (luciferase family)
MHIGLMMECDYRAGKTQEEAFHEAFSTAAHAEEWGFDGIWLAARHFAPQKVGEPYLPSWRPLSSSLPLSPLKQPVSGWGRQC